VIAADRIELVALDGDERLAILRDGRDWHIVVNAGLGRDQNFELVRTVGAGRDERLDYAGFRFLQRLVDLFVAGILFHEGLLGLFHFLLVGVLLFALRVLLHVCG